jgi:PAS domain S-box-containing protein
MRNFFVYEIIIMILSSFYMVSAADAAGKKILVLHSYHQGYEWGDEINRGIKNSFKGNDNLDVYVENIDFLRNSSAENLKAFEDLLRLRYSENKIKPDVIIVSDDPAFNFLLSVRDKLFKNIPVVFCGINNFKPERLKGHKKITGVNESVSVKETVGIALKLREKARRMAVVSDSGFKINLEIFKRIEPEFKDKIEIIYLSELETDELALNLKKLGPDDVVLYLGYLQTPGGVKLSVKESVELITGSTDAAVFGCWDFLIPFGVVGGKVVHGYSQGEAAAEVVLEILKWGRAESIPVRMESPNRYIFNDVLIHKYQIPEKLLPADSLIVNQSAESVIRYWNRVKDDGFFSYSLFENHGSIMLIIDPSNGVIVDANRSAFNFYGYPHLVGKKISEINTLPPDELRKTISRIRDQKQNKYQFEHRLADGQIRTIQVNSYPVEIDGKTFLFSINYDITEKMEAEQGVQSRNRLIIGIAVTVLILLASFTVFLLKNIKKRQESEASLKKSESKLESMLQTLVEGMVTVDVDGRINYSNPAAEKILGIGRDIRDKYYHSRDWKQIDEKGDPFPTEQLPLSIAMREQRVVGSIEHRIESSDGEIKWLSINAAPLRDDTGKFFGGIASFRDITGQKKSEEQIKNLLKEKELLLNEVHHRIKNNMNTIKGLLTLQLTAEENPEAAASIRDAESRVQSMIMLYDRLYSTENFRELSVKEYLQPLTEEIVESFPNFAKVKIETDIEDFILNVKTLAPLGIIVNELLTNMMKYAFTGRESGVIKVSTSVKDNMAVVYVQDNGVGMPDEIDFKNSTGFGLELVNMLVEQIGGRIWIERQEGTRFVLEFTV